MAARHASGPRLFLSDVRLCFSNPLPLRIELNRSEGHYIRDVLRLELGSQIEVGDPATGTIGLATIESLRDTVTVAITAWVCDSPQQQRQIIILCALCKGEKNEQICDWSTELGCAEIHFWQSPRSVVRLKSPNDLEHRTQRLAKIATAAAQQSRQPKPPLVAVHRSLDAALGHLCSQAKVAYLFCSLAPDCKNLIDVARQGDAKIPAVVIIGPEGDISPQEYTLLTTQVGAIPVSLGPAVLRSELAVVTAIALIRAAQE